MAISKETLSLINTFKNPLIEVLAEWKDEVIFIFDKGIINYVDNIRDKYIRTKTFLYRHENVNFYEIYFPVTLSNKTNQNYEINDICDLFLDSKCITIIGNAGSGKSMLLKHVFLLSIEQKVKIPIVIELRNLDEFEGSFFEYVHKILSNKKITPNSKILEDILSNGDFIFLFDGYDEIYSENKKKLTSELIDFIDTYYNCYYIITSRPGANVESLPRFNSYFVNNLHEYQIKEFIKLQLNHCGDSKLAKKIITVVDKPENRDYNSYLSSPLLLSMFIMTFNSYPELPKTKSKFYWNVFDTLCTKHDSFTKHGGYQHERKTGLQNDDFENILKWFAYNSLFKGKYTFDEQYFSELLKKIKVKLGLKCKISDLKYDLTVAISIIMIDGLELKFPHKSLQEYFTSVLIKDQSDEVKKEIYSVKLGNLSTYTNDGNDNLWNLCQEIDYTNFTKYFSLKHIESFLLDIDESSEESICKSFFEWSGFKQAISMDEKTGDYMFNGYEIYGHAHSEILNYLDVLSFLDLSIYGSGKDERNQIDKLFEANLIVSGRPDGEMANFLVDYVNNWNKKAYSSIVELGIKEKLVSAIANANKLKKKLNERIESYEKNKSELLEL